MDKLRVPSNWTGEAKKFVRQLEDEIELQNNRTSSKITSNNTSIQRSSFASLKAYGATGNGTTDDTTAIQAAVDDCIQNNKSLYVPPGTYIMRGAAVRLNRLTADYQGITIQGAGRGKSIFKQGNGEVETSAVVNMFYCHLADTNGTPDYSSFKFGSFTFQDLTFDKNARSNAAPASPYDYEQAAIIKFAGAAGTAVSVDGITLDRCEFIDKAGPGLVVSTSTTVVRSIVINDLQSTEHPSATSAGWGQRGCVELGMDSQHNVITNSTCLYVQIEPVTASSSTRIRRYRISNCKIDTLEMTDSGEYSYVDVVNTYCINKYLNLGMHSTLTNCQFKVTDYFTPYSMKVSNSKIIFPYSNGAITSLTLRNPINDAYITAADFVNCDFVIDSVDPDITPTGYAIEGQTVTLANSPRYTFVDCHFDKRLYGTVNAYRKGEYRFFNCTLAGLTRALNAGSDATYYSRLEVRGCDISKITGTVLYITRGTTSGYKVIIDGDYLLANWSQATTSSSSTAATYIKRPNLYANAAAGSGTWLVGDKVLNNEPASGEYAGWICTTAGTPGTWKGFGLIE